MHHAARAAEALLLAGDVEGAQAQPQEALRIDDELGEEVYLGKWYGASGARALLQAAKPA